jgi:hypothetical protein
VRVEAVDVREGLAAGRVEAALPGVGPGVPRAHQLTLHHDHQGEGGGRMGGSGGRELYTDGLRHLELLGRDPGGVVVLAIVVPEPACKRAYMSSAATTKHVCRLWSPLWHARIQGQTCVHACMHPRMHAYKPVGLEVQVLPPLALLQDEPRPLEEELQGDAASRQPSGVKGRTKCKASYIEGVSPGDEAQQLKASPYGLCCHNEHWSSWGASQQQGNMPSVTHPSPPEEAAYNLLNCCGGVLPHA